MAEVRLENVCKLFDEVVAVDEFNLSIQDKEFVVLVGPSGCGKTTTLRMIAGLESITSGDVYIGDRLINKLPAKDRNIAMVFQNYALYPHMNVYKNMAFGLKLAKGDKQAMAKAQLRRQGIRPKTVKKKANRHGLPSRAKNSSPPTTTTSVVVSSSQPVATSSLPWRISGVVARVTVRQSFQNDSPSWVEGTYLFPLPDEPFSETRIETDVVLEP